MSDQPRPENAQRGLEGGNPQRVLCWILTCGVVLFVILATWNSLARTRLYTSDSLNYVDIARNLTSGRGLVQSTLGFNQPHLWDEDSRIPVPFTTQAPLYPILIAAASRLGIEHADAAFVISGIAYGLMLLVTYHLARTLYDERVAMLSVAALLLYGPMFFIARFAGNEPVGILWVLVSLLLLVKFHKTAEQRPRMVICTLSGITTGLAFATRYALVALLPLALLFLAIESRGPRQALRNLGLCLVGFCLPVLPVLAHNFAATGSFLSGSLPSDLGFMTNLRDALLAIFGSNPLFGGAGRFPVGPTTQLVLALLISLALAVFMLARRRFGELRKVLFENGRWLILAWSLGYLCFILCLRTLFHFDKLGARLIAPAAVTLLMLAIAIVVLVFGGSKAKWPLYVTLVLLAVAVGREILITNLLPADSDELKTASSDRLTWIAQHTTQDDLIMGTDVVDVVFYLDRPAAVSFSEYPYTRYLQYEELVSYVGANCANYDQFYLVLRDHTWMEGELGYRFGGFITDLLAGNLDAYPDLLFLTRFDEGPAFRILTCESVVERFQHTRGRDVPAERLYRRTDERDRQT